MDVDHKKVDIDHKKVDDDHKQLMSKWMSLLDIYKLFSLHPTMSCIFIFMHQTDISLFLSYFHVSMVRLFSRFMVHLNTTHMLYSEAPVYLTPNHDNVCRVQLSSKPVTCVFQMRVECKRVLAPSSYDIN